MTSRAPSAGRPWAMAADDALLAFRQELSKARHDQYILEH
jgi:hypothetical protein